jgi:hypothetical protein
VDGTMSSWLYTAFLPIHGLRASFGIWVYETYGVKQARECLSAQSLAFASRSF